jgi:parallel beta-helix repeat protein
MVATFDTPRSNAATKRVHLRPACHGVHVEPGDDLQSLIDRHHRRTAFCFAAGVYGLSKTVQTQRKFPTIDLRSGAVIDGRDGAFIGIDGADAPPGRRGAVILGGVFQHFGNETAPSASPVILRRNWVVRGTEFKDNFNAGLAIQGDHARVSNVSTHDNGRYGLVVTAACTGCRGPSGVIIEDTEIAFNNTRRLPTNDDAGGTKFSGGTSGMIVRRNEVHDNYGAGLWWDGHSKKAQVYGNVIRDNRNAGILYEISFGGTKIHHNILSNNGVGDGSVDWTLNTQLVVASSDGSRGGRGILIYRNRIDGTAYPLGIVTHAGRSVTKQVRIHDNLLILRTPSTRVGGDDGSGSGEMFRPSAGNRFRANTYRVVDPEAAYWAWNGEILTWPDWQALGHDVKGTVERLG